jgi:diguanylate cyclase (GGDEF)-like protein
MPPDLLMKNRLQAEQLRQVLRNLPVNIAMSLALQATAVTALWSQVDLANAVIWIAIALIVSAMRLSLYRSYGSVADDDQRVLQLLGRLRVTCLMAGGSWALATVLVWDPQQPVPQLLLLVALCGVSAGAATSLAAEQVSAALFQAPIFAGVLVRLWSDSHASARGLGFMVLAYGLFTLVTIRRVHANIADNAVLRMEALERESRFRLQAERDALTGLGNRFALQAQLSQRLATAAAAGRRVGVLYIDLDDFKDINDTRGHRCGDQLLEVVADRLRGCVRDGDLVYRVGGDEFIVVTDNAGERHDLEQLAQRLRQTLAQPVMLDDGDVNCTVSIGIGRFPDDGSDAGSLLKHADVALYQAKNQGRDGFVFYATGQSQQISDRLELERSLAEAIRTESIYLEFQPLIDLETGAIAGVEALARWQHPQRGLVPPATFIPVAERCGHIEALGELVLRQLCRQVQQWKSSMLPLVPVALNVAPQQLDMGSFTRSFAAMTREFRIDPALFDIEVTESALIDRRQGHLQALEQLQQLGARVSIDDFGTGYSSLSYLKHLPIDSVKIDRCFIHDMIEDGRDAAIVSAIVAVGHSLGLSVIAEGVENAAQVLKLKALGCDVVQGFYYQRPVSGSQFAELLMADARRTPAAGGDSGQVLPPGENGGGDEAGDDDRRAHPALRHAL